MGKQGKQCQTLFFRVPKSLQMVTAAMILKDPPSMGFSRQEYWSGVPLPSPHQCPSHMILSPVIHLASSLHLILSVSKSALGDTGKEPENLSTHIHKGGND